MSKSMTGHPYPPHLEPLLQDGRFHEFNDATLLLTDGWGAAAGDLAFANGKFHEAAALYSGAADDNPNHWTLIARAAFAAAFHDTDAAHGWLIDLDEAIDDADGSVEAVVLTDLAEAITISLDLPGPALDLISEARFVAGEDDRLLAYTWLAEAYVCGNRYPDQTEAVLEGLTSWPWMLQVAVQAFRCEGEHDATVFDQVGWLDVEAISRWRATLS